MTSESLLKLLLVDDDPFMRKTVKTMLRVVGRFTVIEAGDGGEALTALDHFQPNLILCDVMMTPMGGLEFVEKLRQHATTALHAIPVIMLTAHANEATVLGARRLKVEGYLVKPVSTTQLGAMIRNILKLTG